MGIQFFSVKESLGFRCLGVFRVQGLRVKVLGFRV